jgi:hypothetical protein
VPDLSDRDLLDALGVDAEPEKQATRTPREERIIAGFEEIQRFYEEHGRVPQHGDDRDIFERLYAVRLDRLRSLEECRALLEPLDHQGLLTEQQAAEQDSQPEAELDDAALLAELGVDDEVPEITELRHVRPTVEKKAAEEIANREPCKDFARFKPLFEQVQQDLNAGIRTTRPYGKRPEIETGRYFILGGQKVYVAEIGEFFVQEYGDRDARLRLIFDNGTESNMLMRSLQRALTKDEAGRRITEPDAGPLFTQDTEEGDQASGTIYVLRSKSDLPLIAENRELIHKIGVTGMDVQKRIAGAKLDPTFLMADVEIVATYELYNINRAKLEHLIHKIFASARLDIQIKDRFGNPVIPREWFLVPLYAIKDAVDKIQNGTITQYLYDATQVALVYRGSDEPA